MSEKVWEEIENDIINSTCAYADKYGMEGLSFRIKEHLIDDCLRSTKETIPFHGIATEELDHYKYAGHISFWFARLQPIDVVIESNVFEVKRRQHAEFKSVSIQTVKDERGALYDERALLINEYVAIDLANHIIKTCQTAFSIKAKKVDSKKKKAFYADVINNEVRYKATQKDLVWSLRKHNHTCRTWTLLLDVGFKTALEREFSNGEEHD